MLGPGRWKDERALCPDRAPQPAAEPAADVRAHRPGMGVVRGEAVEVGDEERAFVAMLESWLAIEGPNGGAEVPRPGRTPSGQGSLRSPYGPPPRLSIGPRGHSAQEGREAIIHPMAEKLTSPSVLRALLDRHGVRLRSKLGQHLLVDENVLRRIVELAEPRPDETAVEVGAGAGTLTVALAPHVRELLAVEVDRRLIPVLEETTAGYPNVRVVPGDFRELRLSSFRERILVVGNLPYGITSDVLLKLLREREAVDRAVVMVQREVGEKLRAPPGPEASRLGVHLRAYFEVELVRKVPRTVFFPPPEVDSALIRVRKLPQPRIAAPEEAFERMLALVFSGRRKTLRRVLLGQLPAAEVDRILAELGLDPQVRGEALPLEALDRLALSSCRVRGGGQARGGSR